MRCYNLLPFVLFGMVCLSPGNAQAQDAPSQESSTRAPVTYVYGHTPPVTPAGPAQVRRRIAQIGMHPTTQRIVYPVIVILPQGQGIPTPPSSILPTYPPATSPNIRLVQDLNPIERAFLDTGLFSTTDVVFEFDRSTLLPVSETILDTVGPVLGKYPSLRIEIAGHTDGIGSEDYNQRLSERRAQVVRNYLLTLFNISPDRIEARGYGETQPVASNTISTGRTLNRRVEFRVLDDGEMQPSL